MHRALGPPLFFPGQPVPEVQTTHHDDVGFQAADHLTERLVRARELVRRRPGALFQQRGDEVVVGHFLPKICAAHRRQVVLTGEQMLKPAADGEMIVVIGDVATDHLWKPLPLIGPTLSVAGFSQDQQAFLLLIVYRSIPGDVRDLFTESMCHGCIFLIVRHTYYLGAT